MSLCVNRASMPMVENVHEHGSTTFSSVCDLVWCSTWRLTRARLGCFVGGALVAIGMLRKIDCVILA